jgi:hypothetical protein
MDPIAIAVTQFAFNLLVWTLIARWYVAPRLAKLPIHAALMPPMFIHLIRPISMWMMAPASQMGITVPEAWGRSTAIGDLVAAGLALATLFALRHRARPAIAMAWIANIVGVLDAAKNGVYGMQLAVIPKMGPATLIVPYAVPILFVSHGVVFWLLVRHRMAPTPMPQ